jgi:hypothetical protein
LRERASSLRCNGLDLLVEADLTGKHEMMKSRENPTLAQLKVIPHVFMISCFPVKKLPVSTKRS